jgi:predicted Ser/Thr protein kinase
MSQETSLHPDLEQLAAFDGGRLSAAQREEVERHIASCDVCCRRLETLPEDAFTALVRCFGGSTPTGRDTSPSDQPPSGAAGGHAVPAALVGHCRYRVLAEVGQGGMGVVYKAVQLLLDRVVALKVIHPQVASRPGFAERFRQEVRALARLNHPGIAQAYDADQAGPLLFLVMEYVAGISLDRLVSQRGPLPVDEVVELARQAALALQHAHERGILHRDLKPHNLIRMPDGAIKIVDFGLAQLASDAGDAESSPTALLLGTPDYTAPEQARAPRSADARSDLYSLGCTLYQLLAGQVPFPGGTALQKLVRHQEESPRPIRDLRPDVPQALAVLLGRLLERNPAHRPSSAALVARALTDLAAPADASPKRPHRRRALFAFCAVGLVLLAGGVAALVWPHGSAHPNGQPREPPVTAAGLALDEPDLAGPELLAQWKRRGRDRVLDWLRQNNRWTPDAEIVQKTAENIDSSLGRFDGFQMILGGKLLKTGRPALVGMRLGEFFVFELSAAHTRALALPANHRRFQLFIKAKEARRPSPQVRLSDLHIDHAEALPRHDRIRGALCWEGRLSPGKRLHVRLSYYPVPLRKRVIGLYHLRTVPQPGSAQVSFDFGELGGPEVHKGPLVLFVEVASTHKGQEVVESNTLAVLVTPQE